MVLSVEDAVDSVRKKYGDMSFVRITDEAVQNLDVIPSGSIALDRALGVGGYPRGRVTEILGNPGSGKTTCALHAIAEAQKLGGHAVMIDAEHALDIHYAMALGVDLDKLYLNQPDNAEQALGIAEACIRSGAFMLLVVDSVAALAPQRELDGEAGDAHVGLLARLMSQFFRRMSGAIKKTNTAVVFINQYRMNIHTVGYGSPKTTPGGRALEYGATVRMDVARTGSTKLSNTVTGNSITVKVTKNKVAPPYRNASFEIDFGKGISRTGEVIDMCLEGGHIKKAGAWLVDRDRDVKVQGREKLKEYLEENPEYMLSLEKIIAENDCGSGNNGRGTGEIGGIGRGIDEGSVEVDIEDGDSVG